MNEHRIDPMDSAYLAIGAARALDTLSDSEKDCARGDGDEMQLIQDMIDLAPMLAQLYDENRAEWGGIWAYEIAEPLAYAVVIARGAQQECGVWELARRLIADSIADYNS